ncbi:11369_t:CDS:10, partial [Scutellospora calospora]
RNNLVVVSVFDREVNVRRASSAAFHENVGRQGIFPHGIEIVTTADYFTVGNRVNAFLDISVKIAEFVEYKYHLIDHLSKQTISNWDKSMRVLGSKALHNFTPLDLDYFINNVLPFLIPQTLSLDVHTRHGALLAIGEICLAWSNLQKDDKSWIERHKDLIMNIANIIGSLPENVFTDFGSEVTVQAAVSHIASLANAGWPVTDDILKKWKSVVYDLLSRKDEIGQEIAKRAVEALVSQYGIDGSEIDIYPFNKSSLCCDRKGFTLALGVIQYSKISEYLDRVVDSLIFICKNKKCNYSLATICKKLGDSLKTVVSKTTFDKIINAYFTGLEDYSTDQRGDVGTWVREACINKEIYLFNLPAREILQSTLPKDEEIHWTLPLELYPRMVKLLALKEYRFDLLVGLVIVAGGINDTLLDYANELPAAKLLEDSSLSLLNLANELLNIFRHNESKIVSLFLYWNLCGMTSLGGTVRNRSLYLLLGLLVRRLTADQLYLTLTGSTEDESEEMLKIEDILVNTDWDSPVPQLKELRNQLYHLLGLNVSKKFKS